MILPKMCWGLVDLAQGLLHCKRAVSDQGDPTGTVLKAMYFSFLLNRAGGQAFLGRGALWKGFDRAPKCAWGLQGDLALPGSTAQLLWAMSPESGGGRLSGGAGRECSRSARWGRGECWGWELQGHPSTCPAGCWRGVRRQQLSVAADLGWG